MTIFKQPKKESQPIDEWKRAYSEHTSRRTYTTREDYVNKLIAYLEKATGKQHEHITYEDIENELTRGKMNKAGESSLYQAFHRHPDWNFTDWESVKEAVCKELGIEYTPTRRPPREYITREDYINQLIAYLKKATGKQREHITYEDIENKLTQRKMNEAGERGLYDAFRDHPDWNFTDWESVKEAVWQTLRLEQHGLGQSKEALSEIENKTKIQGKGEMTIWEKLRLFWGTARQHPQEYLEFVQRNFGEAEFAKLYTDILPLSYPWLNAISSAKLVAEMQEKGLLPFKPTILDCGSGPSTFTRALKAAGLEASVTDLDASKEMLKYSINTRKIVADICKFTWHEPQVDLVNCSLVLDVVPLQGRSNALLSMGSALKTDGILLLTLSGADAFSESFVNGLKEMGLTILEHGALKTRLKESIPQYIKESIQRAYREIYGEEPGNAIFQRLTELLEKESSYLIAIKKSEKLQPVDSGHFAIGTEQTLLKNDEIKKVRSDMRKYIQKNPRLQKLDNALLEAIGEGLGADSIQIRKILNETERIVKFEEFVEKAKSKRYDEAIIRQWFENDLKEDTLKNTIRKTLGLNKSQFAGNVNDAELHAIWLWATGNFEEYENYVKGNNLNKNRLKYIMDDAHVHDPFYLLTKEHRDMLSEAEGRTAVPLHWLKKKE